MAYIIETNNINVLRHWDFFLKTLENTCRIGGIWKEFKMEISPYRELYATKDTPRKIWIKGATKDYDCIIDTELLTNNNSMYFKVNMRGKILFSKKGQAFTDNENNSELIFEICNYIFDRFSNYYHNYIQREEKQRLCDEKHAKVVNEMIAISDNNLKGECYGGRADLRIKKEDLSDIQFLGVAHDDDELTFDINLKDINYKKAAMIAKILTE